jgi:hypothetical protein
MEDGHFKLRKRPWRQKAHDDVGASSPTTLNSPTQIDISRRIKSLSIAIGSSC